MVKSKFYSLFEDIDCAESHIHIFYYAIGDDHIGNELKEKIINKVKQGIKVRLLYDGLGCNKTNRKYFKANDRSRRGSENVPPA